MSAFILKLIASVCMGIDHFGAVFTGTPLILRMIGRIAFPIYVFFIAEGCVYTKNRIKYMLRLGIFALISEIPFDMAFNGWRINFFSFTNVFYTLFLGVACITAYELIKEQYKKKTGIENSVIINILALLPSLVLIYLAQILGTDYGMFGVTWILLVYMVKTRFMKIIIMAAGIFYKYGIWLLMPVYYNFNNFLMLGFALLSVVFIFLYNGSRGSNKFKWAFYCYYPAHILALVVISYFLAA